MMIVENPYRTPDSVPDESEIQAHRSTLYRDLTTIFVLWGITGCGVGALIGLIVGDLMYWPMQGDDTSVIATLCGAFVGGVAGIAIAHVFSGGVRTRMYRLDEHRQAMLDEVSRIRQAAGHSAEPGSNPYADPGQGLDRQSDK